MRWELTVAGATADQLARGAAAAQAVFDEAKVLPLNAAYARWFPTGKLPARTCIGVTALAGGADVEIDLLAVRREAS